MTPEQLAEMKRLLNKADDVIISWKSPRHDTERIWYYPEEFLALIAHLESLEAKLGVAKEVLEFYADQEMYLQGCDVGDITEWELDCYGNKAREALAKLNGENNENSK